MLYISFKVQVESTMHAEACVSERATCFTPDMRALCFHKLLDRFANSCLIDADSQSSKSLQPFSKPTPSSAVEGKEFH